MNEKLLKYISEKPKVYQESCLPFWDDEHISKHMLNAHLDFTKDSASRSLETIKATCHWIDEYCSLHGCGKKLLDLGCGPGLYAEQLYKKSYDVTGIDFSKRSIEYAKRHALKTHKTIQYKYQNYLDVDFENEFDVIIMIYCDFGVLSPSKRKQLLSKVYKALKKGGIFIFDVLTIKHEEDFVEFQTIDYFENGFWANEEHIVIERHVDYINTHNILEQYIIILKNSVRSYNVWNQCYNKEMIKEELKSQNLLCVDIFGGTQGELLEDDHLTMCLVAQKE